MRISADGIALIKRWEGFKPAAYRCPAGVWTIGYGHTRTAREGMTVTEAEAEALLREDIAEAERAVNRLVRVPLTQGQFDALVSWVYNFGADSLRRSTLLKRINAQEWEAVPGEWMRWVNARDPATGKLRRMQGLVNRRSAELGLWARGSHVAGRDAVTGREIEAAGEPARARDVLATDTAKGTLAATIAGIAAVMAQAEPVVRLLGDLPWQVSLTAVVATSFGVLVWRWRRATT